MGSAFGHISFTANGPTAFESLRQLLRVQQATGRIRPQLILDALRDTPYLLKLVLWRILHRQLVWPGPATYQLQVVIEQMPRRENCITLSQEKDLFGLPVAAIDWRVGAQEWGQFAAFKRCFDGFWRRHQLQEIGELHWAYDPESAPYPRLPGDSDIYHPGGSTRMGTQAQSAVVDRDLRTFAVPNLWVSSTSVFPSGASANPTLTLMLFTMRLADHLCGRFFKRELNDFPEACNEAVVSSDPHHFGRFRKMETDL